MFTSSRISNLVLRLGLAAVFLWFGIDKFIHPTYWLNAWVPADLLTFLSKFKLEGPSFIYLTGAFEVLVGFSLATNVLVKLFSLLGIIFVLSILVTVGVSEVTVRDFGLISGFVSILFWPSPRSYLR